MIKAQRKKQESAPDKIAFFAMIDLCVKAKAAGYRASYTAGDEAVRIEGYRDNPPTFERDPAAAREICAGLHRRGFTPAAKMEGDKIAVFIKSK